ncbi:WD40 repeat-like protein [Lentinus tigrinus ALCF2SS1-7]|uniref:WD40 repeat-like protein n=1 Tax=Lentinus tigrinus ALCF2SS1-7 TaxID=1328758 RepID=UPI001166221E|nr:WD40 repeat-like protein [Lentinus tigrinus ALCF2SS1-7]
MSATMEQLALKVPVTFSVNRDGTRKTANDLSEQSLSSAISPCLASWGLENLVTLPEVKSEVAPGVAVGCKDGSVFILRSSGSTSTATTATSSPPLEPLTSPTSTKRFLGLGRPSSRSASPSSTKSSLSPFHVTRSRVVSSVTAEQAEAPKNYVDFEEEQEKLRGMLKGKGHRDRHASTSRSRPDPSAEKIAVSQTSSNPGSSLRKEDTRSYLSTALSPASSTLSLSTSNPPSPPLFPAPSPEPGSPSLLTLRCHFFPPHSDSGRVVTSLKVHEGGRFLTCLGAAGGLSVHSTLDGSCLASTVIEARPTKVAIGGKSQPVPSMLWVWRTLLVAASEESILLLACASPDEFYPAGQFGDTVFDSENQTLITAFELRLGVDASAQDVDLEYAGQWTVDTHWNSIGLRAVPESDHLILFYVNSSGYLISRSLKVNDMPPPPPPDLPESHSSTHLPLPNPFKALKSLSTDHIQDTANDTVPDRVELGNEVDNGEVGLTEPLLGLRAQDGRDFVRLCAWSAHEVLVVNWSNSTVERGLPAALPGIQDVKWIGNDSFSALYLDHAEIHRVSSGPRHDGDQLQCQRTQNVFFTQGDAAILTPGGHVVSTHMKHGRRRVHYTSVDASKGDASPRTRSLWKARTDASSAKAARRISSMLPLELDTIILGYTDGCLARSSLVELSRGSGDSSQASDVPLPGSIVSVDLGQNPRTGERVFIGGSDDGTIALWTYDTLKLCARWTFFTTPLARVVALHDEKVGRLHGCALCISQDGTIAVIAVDGYQFVYLVPASAAPLTRLCLGEDNMLLIYGDGRARLWDTRTREFWRSMGVEKAEELVQQGGWHEWTIGSPVDSKNILSAPSHGSLDDAATLLVDISELLRQFSSSAALTGSSVPALSAKAKLEHARALLSILLTFGVSEGIDGICTESLSIPCHPSAVGLTSPGSFSILPQSIAMGAWTLSPEASTDRALAILSVLQYLTQFEDLAQDANTVMTFYAASVGQLVHEAYHPPSLPRLGHHLLYTLSTEVRQATRLLFDAGVARLSDQEATEIVETWQQYLPTLQPVKEKDWTQSALALCICGFIAVDKYSLLPTSILTDIAKSIASYLHDETSPHRSLAIDLCSRGFQVWQQYVDAVEMLRALFTLATTTKKEAISIPNIGAQARTAVLQIAASNTPLFMTTLAIDILQPRSTQHRKSVMQLVIFLIRKKPLVLYNNLPRLVEAIVKSLDPNSNATREAVLDSATDILSHIVQTFPTVDFHMGSQRLAVGTSEGAVIMYDLKTATRLYVLEGHKKRTTACSFSPDGRRLVTLSLEESNVLVWKVGSSFTSFFMPGAPPFQGHSGSEPFKRLSFNIGDAAHMSLEASLVDVQFEWTSDRNVKLKINDSILTFST